MSEKQKGLVKLGLRVLVTGVSLVWVVKTVDFGQFRQAVASARWGLLVGVWLFNAALFWVRSYQFQLILRKLQCRVPVNTLFGASAVMALYGMIMPGMFSLAAKWYVIKRAAGSGSLVLCAMVFNQVSMMAVMVAFSLLALVITNPLKQLPLTAAQVHGLSATALALFFAIILVFSGLLSRRVGIFFDRIVDRLLVPIPGSIRSRIETVLGQLKTFRTAGAGFHSLIVALALVTGAIAGGVLYWLAAKAANCPDVPFMVYVWLQAIVYILGRTPIAVANCGPREFVLINLLGLYGVDKSHALLMSTIVFSAYIFMGFLGALYQVGWSLYNKRPL